MAHPIDEARILLRSGNNNCEIEAAKILIPSIPTATKEEAVLVLQAFLVGLLNAGKFFAAARLLWGEDMFDPRPGFVQLIWNELPKQAQLLLMGCGAAGKSYNMAVWLLLDWLRDPTGTNVSVVSVTAGHAKRNVFAHLKNLHAGASFPLPGTALEKSILVGNDEKQGIHLLAIPQGSDGKGRARGFHPSPREEAHPIFGKLTRMRVILDEAEEIPEGIWEEIGNALITRDGVEHIKVFAASNPKDRTSKYGTLCEPEGGWASVDKEVDIKWDSKHGWRVVRLDGARCENVAQKKVVYPGLITWEGFQQYLKSGETSAEADTMARGWFPEMGAERAAIPLNVLNQARGTFTFIGEVTPVASLDVALQGHDRPVLTLGRFGKVLLADSREATAIQIDQQVQLENGDSTQLVQQVVPICKEWGVADIHLGLDMTGNGEGVYSGLRVHYGSNVFGINFGWGPTKGAKVLDDDAQLCEELYDDVVTEMYLASRKLMEAGLLKIAPTVEMPNLERELTGRRIKSYNAGGRQRVESKDDYKKRPPKKSPDWADSFVMLPHIVRIKGKFSGNRYSKEAKEQQKEQSQIDKFWSNRRKMSGLGRKLATVCAKKIGWKV